MKETNVSSIWRSINIFMRKNWSHDIFTGNISPETGNISPETGNISPDSFNGHFLYCLPDYWPISLPLERHVHSHPTSFIEKHNTLFQLQSGFRLKHPCRTALSAMRHMWLPAIDHSEMVGAVFLDFKNAFDLADHIILQQKLKAHLSIICFR